MVLLHTKDSAASGCPEALVRVQGFIMAPCLVLSAMQGPTSAPAAGRGKGRAAKKGAAGKAKGGKKGKKGQTESA